MPRRFALSISVFCAVTFRRQIGLTALALVGALTSFVTSSARAAAPAIEASAAVADLDAATLPRPLQDASLDTWHAVQWVLRTQDHRGRPFAVVDKKSARIHVMDRNGELRGTSAVLLGIAPGDGTAPGMEGRQPASLSWHERTTPAGRFESEPGHNLTGEAIVWFDYTAKLAIHRLRPAPPIERRAERLASSESGDNRISLGCVVVPTVFYDDVIGPLLGKSLGVVYVLPESQPLARMLDAWSAGSRLVTAQAVTP